MMYGQLVEYRGYVGSIKYSSEDNIYYGELLNIRDLVSYDGNNIEELYRNYKESVNDYIDLKIKMEIKNL